jgi:hypothetical protein
MEARWRQGLEAVEKVFREVLMPRDKAKATNAT